MKRILTAPARVALAFAAVCTAASAQTSYYLRQSQASGWNWHTASTGNANSWHTTPSGTAVQLTAMDTAGHYYTNGFTVRTPESSGVVTFSGAKLILNGGGLSLKTTNNSARAIVGWLETSGATSITAANANHYHALEAVIFDQAGTTTFTASAGRSIDLITGTLSGAGTMRFDGGATTSNFRFNITNASAFTGAFEFNSGTLLLQNNLSMGGSLSIATGSLVNLTHSISVTALTIGGANLGVGTYSYEYLNTNYGAIFTSGSELAQITVTAVPEPSVFAALAGAGALAFAGLRRRRACRA